MAFLLQRTNLRTKCVSCLVKKYQCHRSAKRGFASEGFGGRAPADATPETSFRTLCIHGGQQVCSWCYLALFSISRNLKPRIHTNTRILQPDPVTGSRVPAIHQNTGFVFRDSDDAAAKFNLAGEILQLFGAFVIRLNA